MKTKFFNSRSPIRIVHTGGHERVCLPIGIRAHRNSDWLNAYHLRCRIGRVASIPFDLFRKRLHQNLFRPIFQEEADWPMAAWVVGVDASDGIKVRNKEKPHDAYAKQTSNQNKS